MKNALINTDLSELSSNRLRHVPSSSPIICRGGFGVQTGDRYHSDTKPTAPPTSPKRPRIVRSGDGLDWFCGVTDTLRDLFANVLKLQILKLFPHYLYRISKILVGRLNYREPILTKKVMHHFYTIGRFSRSYLSYFSHPNSHKGHSNSRVSC